MRLLFSVILSWALLIYRVAFAAEATHFKKVFLIILENTSYEEALKQPYFSKLVSQGATFSNFMAEAHPSQPNYIALVTGSTQKVTSDNPVNLSVRHLGDLLEAKGLQWKVYAEAFPGNCFQGATSTTYARKHVPFISFTNIQKDPTRCQRIVNATELATDLQDGTLPDFSLYIPDMNNDGHDTGAAYADRWLSGELPAWLQDPKVGQDTLFIVTFDESDDYSGPNHIFTVFVGAGVAPGVTSAATYNHYSVLRTIEDELGLGTLGASDSTATPITDIWKN